VRRRFSHRSPTVGNILQRGLFILFQERERERSFRSSRKFISFDWRCNITGGNLVSLASCVAAKIDKGSTRCRAPRINAIHKLMRNPPCDVGLIGACGRTISGSSGGVVGKFREARASGGVIVSLISVIRVAPVEIIPPRLEMTYFRLRVAKIERSLSKIQLEASETRLCSRQRFPESKRLALARDVDRSDEKSNVNFKGTMAR